MEPIAKAFAAAWIPLDVTQLGVQYTGRFRFGLECPMQPHSVKFGVTPCMRIECKFWIEGDGWNATIESLGLTVRAPSFEAAKNDMELTLGKHIESLLGQRIPVDRGHAA